MGTSIANIPAGQLFNHFHSNAAFHLTPWAAGSEVLSMSTQLSTLSIAPPRRPRADVGKTRLPRSETVLLLVDFINPMEFPQARRLTGRAVRAARATAALKARMTRAGALVVYANDNYGHWRSAFDDVLAYCLSLGGPSAEIAELLRPSGDDLVILKPRHSAFYCTPLELLLAQMRARNLVVTGIAADICVQLTAMDANLRGYNLWVPANCVASESVQSTRGALRYMRRVLKAHVAAADVVPRERAGNS